MSKHPDPLDEIKDLIRQLAAKHLNDRADEFYQQFMRLQPQEAEARQIWMERSANPSILSPIMNLFVKEGRLPFNPGTLGLQLVQQLWQEAERRGTHQGITLPQMEAALGSIAFEQIDVGYRPCFPLDYGLEKLGGQKHLQIAVDANFVRLDGELCQFVHPLIQMYFAAVEIDWLGLNQCLETPRFEDQGFMIAPRAAGRLDDVIIVLCGIRDAEAVIRQVMDIDIYLAQMCLTHVEGVSATLHQQIMALLLEKVSPEFADCKRGALEALAQMGDEAVPGLLNLLRNKDDPDGRSGAAWALKEIRNPVVVPTLIECLLDLRVSWYFGVAVCDYAAGALQAIGTAPGLEALRQWPKQIIPFLKSRDVNMRYHASFKLSTNTVLEYKDVVAYTVVVPYLTELLADREKSTDFVGNGYVDVEAAHALYMIGTPEAERALNDWNPHYLKEASEKYYRDRR